MSRRIFNGLLHPALVLAMVVLLWPVAGLHAQVVIDELVVNDHQVNTAGVWRPRIAVAADGSFSVAWQDYNDRPNINFNSSNRSQVAVQRYSAAAQPLEQIHFFRGESNPLSMWLSDYMENAVLSYLSSGELLLLMQHAGRFVIGTDDVPSSEVTIGAINANGQIIKLNGNGNNVQYPLNFSTSTRQYNPRLAITPQNLIVAILDEKSNDSDFRNIAFRALDTGFNEVITREVPHNDGVGTAPHTLGDMATNGQLYAAVWQDGRYNNLWSVSVQFYTQQGALGTNYRMNQTEPGTAFALAPSIAMNSAGQSVAVWFDSRNGAQLFGQRFDASGAPVETNFQITETPAGGAIYYRPEVAVRDDGSFMVVWTDSTQVAGNFRARARQFDAAGNPAGQPFTITSPDLSSGLPHVTTDGTLYYCTWLDNRLNPQQANVFMKVIGNVATSYKDDQLALPGRIRLHQNYPNPFNPVTSLRFEIDEPGPVQLEVFDLQGRPVRLLINRNMNEGTHNATFDASGLASGVYIARLAAGGTVLYQRMLLVK
jgi:hypothetical protein